MEVLLGHPGGPYFVRRDRGVWTIPKGLMEGGEPAFRTARREFVEETGLREDIVPPEARCLFLGDVVQRGGKRVVAWGFEGDCDPAALRSNCFEIEWPPRSGTQRSFPEIDRFELFALNEAMQRINPAQRAFLERLAGALEVSHEDQDPHPE